MIPILLVLSLLNADRAGLPPLHLDAPLNAMALVAAKHHADPRLGRFPGHVEQWGSNVLYAPRPFSAKTANADLEASAPHRRNIRTYLRGCTEYVGIAEAHQGGYYALTELFVTVCPQT